MPWPVSNPRRYWAWRFNRTLYQLSYTILRFVAVVVVVVVVVFCCCCCCCCCSANTRIPRASMLKVKHLPALFSLPCSKDIHILFRFGSVTNEDMEQNVAHGHFSVLSKPVSLRCSGLSVVY